MVLLFHGFVIAFIMITCLTSLLQTLLSSNFQVVQSCFNVLFSVGCHFADEDHI